MSAFCKDMLQRSISIWHVLLIVIFLLRIHSEGSVVCKMTLNFAAAPASKSDELLKDLQEKVSTGKVGALSVDSTHILNLEPEVGKIVTQWCEYILNVDISCIKGSL